MMADFCCHSASRQSAESTSGGKLGQGQSSGVKCHQQERLVARECEEKSQHDVVGESGRQSMSLPQTQSQQDLSTSTSLVILSPSPNKICLRVPHSLTRDPLSLTQQDLSTAGVSEVCRTQINAGGDVTGRSVEVE